MSAVRKSKRLNPSWQERNHSGRFKRKCGALNHDPCKEENTSLVDLRKRPKIKSDEYSLLLRKGIVTSQTNFICKTCLSSLKSQQTFPSKEQDNVTDNEDDSEEDGEDDLVLKCIDVGNEINKLISPDINGIENVKSIEQLNNYTPLKWLSDRPTELLQLICSICKVDINTTGTKKLIALAKIIELIYYCANSRTVFS